MDLFLLVLFIFGFLVALFGFLVALRCALYVLKGMIIWWVFYKVHKAVQDKIKHNPIIAEHIGTITRFKVNLSATVKEIGEDSSVFDVTGTKGSGKLRVDVLGPVGVLGWRANIDVPRAQMILGTGESYQLFPNDPLKDWSMKVSGERKSS